MKKQTVRDIDVRGKTVLVRVDYNVPIAGGKVKDDLRIKSGKPTLDYLLERDCKLVLISHLGEPKKAEKKFSLKPVAAAATKVLKHSVKFVADCIGPEAEAAVAALKPHQILLLENLRFHPEETKNDPKFAKQLASYGEVFVNDAFAVEHRAHASLVGVPKHLPAVAGFLVEHEVDTITKALDKPERPLMAVIGGAKVSTKIDILENLIKKVDIIVIGGAMANTFLAADGYPVGKSLYEKDQIETAQKIKAQAEDKGVDLILPVDVVVTTKITPRAKGEVKRVIDVGAKDIIVDLGPESIKQAEGALKLAETVIWNGPLGITEQTQFAKGSLALARAIGASRAKSLIGGGDTADFIDAAGLHDKFDFVSTGGGASLELMAGKKLPGVEALRNK